MMKISQQGNSTRHLPRPSLLVTQICAKTIERERKEENWGGGGGTQGVGLGVSCNFIFLQI